MALLGLMLLVQKYKGIDMHCNNGLNNKLVESLVENKVAQETGDLKYLQDSMYEFVKTLKEIILGEYSPEFFNKYVDEALKLHGSNLEEFLKIPKMGLELRQALESIDDAIDTSNQEFKDNLVLLLDRFQTTLDNIVFEARDAYETALDNGFEGTKQEWLEHLEGDSAYKIATLNGFHGTEQQWLDHLEGDSAYEIAVKNGYRGSQSEWLRYIRADGFIQSIQQFATNDSETQVQIPDYGSINSLQGYIKELFENGGIADRFKTLADLQISPLVDGDYALVADDIDSNNGIYIKDGGEWVKSKYDVSRLLASIESLDSSGDLLIVQDSNSQKALVLSKEGRLFIPSLDTDVASAIVERVDDDEADSAILTVYDRNGLKTLIQDSNGDLILPTIGNLTDALNSVIKDTSTTPSPTPQTDGAKYADYAIAHSTDSEIKTGDFLLASEIDASGKIPHPVKFVRVPAITRTDRNEYILFFEAREVSSDAGTMSFCSAKVSVDPQTYEVTTSDFAVVQQSDDSYNYMQGCGVKLPNGDILTIYMGRNGVYDHKLHMKRSIDGGLSWGEVVDLSHLITSNELNQISPCSQGIVKQFGDNKGRLIFPVWTTQPNVYPDNNSKTAFIYSDDDGDTWHMGDTNILNEANGGNELQVAEMTDGNLLFSVRGRAWNKRIFIYNSKDNEYSWIDPVNFSNTKIMGGLIQGLNDYDFTTEKLVMVTAANSGRTGIWIWVSYDNAKSWIKSELEFLKNTTVSYTGVESIDAAHLFILHETSGFRKLSYNIVPINHTLKGVK